jgi:hypothetical protein
MTNYVNALPTFCGGKWDISIPRKCVSNSGLPDFQTKNPDLGKFWRVLHWKMLGYYMAIWYILRLVGILYGQLVLF